MVDLNSVTIKYEIGILEKLIKEISSKHPRTIFLNVNFKTSKVGGNKQINNDKNNHKFDGIIEIENIFDYCDKISSSYGIISLSSGVSHLSSALQAYSKNLKSFCIMDNEWYCYHLQKGIYIFDNIEYIIF